MREERDVRWQVVCGAFQVFYACVLMLNKEFSYAILTFRGPCIMIYSYNKSQQDALLLIFLLVKNSFLTLLAVNITIVTNTYCCVYSVETPDDGQ